MKLPRIGSKLRIVLQLGVGLGLLAFLLARVDWQRGLSLIRNAEPGLVAVLFAIHIADRTLMALKWHQLLHVLDQGLSRWGAICVYYESTFVGFALPLGGLGPDIVRFARLRTRGIEPHVTLASMIMERLIGLVATLAVVALGLVALARLARESALREFAVAAAIAVFVAGAVAAVLIFHPASGRAFSRLFKLPAIVNRVRIAKYVDAVRTYSGRRPLLTANLGLSLIEQTMAVLAYWVGSRALGIPLPFVVCLAVAPVTVMIQRLPVSYAGLGLREGSAAALLVALGYDYSEALTLLMMLFVVFFISMLPGAVIFATSGRPRAEVPAS